jgi:NAD(P)H dehydrogenase (quinone)
MNTTEEIVRIAVTGATGALGGQVARLLGDTAHEVVALTRRNADYGRPGGPRTAVRDVDTLVFVSSDGETARLLIHHRNVIDAAIATKISTSSR